VLVPDQIDQTTKVDVCPSTMFVLDVHGPEGG